MTPEIEAKIRTIALLSATIGVRDRKHPLDVELRTLLSIRETEAKTFVRALHHLDQATRKCTCGDPLGVIMYGPPEVDAAAHDTFQHIRYGCSCDGQISSGYTWVGSIIHELLVIGAQADAKWTGEESISSERVTEILVDATEHMARGDHEMHRFV